MIHRGEATWDEGLLLFLQRSGYREETYHTFSYSPLSNDAGGVAGMLCVVIEDTERVIGARRMATLRDLGSDSTAVRTEDDVLVSSSRQLGDPSGSALQHAVHLAVRVRRSYGRPMASLLVTRRRRQ